MTFPSDKPDLSATRATSGTDKLSSPDHLVHHKIEDDNIEGLMGKVGIDGSTDSTTLDYKVNSPYGPVRDKKELVFIIDGGGSEITTGVKGDVRIPFDCFIERVYLLADQSGSIQVDIWKDTYANFPPTDADSICGGNEPAISSDDQYEDTDLSGWTRHLSRGDILRFNVDSVTTITRCTVILELRRID